MNCVIYISLLSLFAFKDIFSYPTGPPSSCVSTPNHGFDPQDPSTNPYTLTVKKGQSGYDISIQGTQKFKGFLIKVLLKFFFILLFEMQNLFQG